MYVSAIFYGLHIFTYFKEPALNRGFQCFHQKFSGMEVKKHSGIRGNYILGDDRALILAGPVKNDELGIWTVEKPMLEKLNRYFEDSWSKATRLEHEQKK